MQGTRNTRRHDRGHIDGISSRLVRRTSSVIWLAGEIDAHLTRHAVLDLSPSGMRIMVFEPVGKGDRFMIRIMLPDVEGPVVAHGVARWVKDIDPAQDMSEVGIEFTDIDPEGREKIKFALKTRAAKK